ncbi:MAG TPA: CTP synthase [Clostridiaceae bacterium]|nr:CTP synthase [Clostridiaceae bacterium]
MSTKYIFVTGGVVSGLGKGITAAALGRLLIARGLTVRIQKFDPYINVDPALMNPTQHGEIFITEDGAETDLDIGHYERFTDVNLSRESDITSGKVYRDVITRERAGGYHGGTVQVVPHIINEIKEHVFQVSREGDPDVVIAEIGGTIGDMEGQPFIEAIRQVSYQVGRDNVLFIHVTLLPYLTKSCELKTKPTQHSVQKLLSFGIQPDILVCRTEIPFDQALKQKLALYCNVTEEAVIQNLDCDSVYELPLMLEQEGLARVVCNHLGIAQYVEPDLSGWKDLVERIRAARRPLNISLVGKYIELYDAYYSVTEALDHASIAHGVMPVIDWISAEDLEGLSKAEVADRFKDSDAILVPGGFGPRGMEGMIAAAAAARDNNIPYLGLGLGMQMAVVEYARNVTGIRDAHTDECEAPCSDIFYYAGLTDEMIQNLSAIPYSEQPMRIGAYPMRLQEGSRLASIYKSLETSERHHHRRELNPAFQAELSASGMLFSGTSPDGLLVEAFELPGHPCYMGIISHPEFKSRPYRPHPLFDELIRCALAYQKKRKAKNVE